MVDILVIDDEKAIVKLLKIALTKLGFNVQSASGGAEGIKKFDNGFFDLVITDMRMPEVDGYAVMRHIRNSTRNLTPIVGISGTPWLLENEEFDALLVKPFSMNALFETVSRLTVTPSSLMVNG